VATQLLDAARDAFTLGLQVSALASAFLAAATAVVAVILLRDVRMGSDDRAADAEPAPSAVPAVELE
jgi:MFS transporter, DHA2 family, multidrug resistance protein